MLEVVRLLRYALSISEVSFVTNPFIGQEIGKQPIKRQVSYDKVMSIDS